MKDSRGQSAHARRRHSAEPSLHVICLAAGGGPSESDVTGFLVRSVSKQWSKGSVLALDAGSHLSSIIRLLEADFPLISHPRQPSPGLSSKSNTNGSRRPSAVPRTDVEEDDAASGSSRSTTPERNFTTLQTGPFAGLPFPFSSARANAGHVIREHMSTYLITHPHLDHISAFAINTAAFHNTARPKKLAALTSTVNAVKAHIFNNVIWPNLTDEDGGVGLVTFQRLADGGNVAVGEGQGTGYIEVCDGLCVRGMKISHGRCMKDSSALHQAQSDIGWSEVSQRRNSIPYSADKNSRPITALSQPGTPKHNDTGTHPLVVDSTAYFIRDDHSHREILFFGDVEPDSISLLPRTSRVWTEAAHKIASKKLKAIFIECSYDDSQGDNVLFGHLAPRHLVQELRVLSDMVKSAKTEEVRKRESKKRKRFSVPESPEIRHHAVFAPPAQPSSQLQLSPLYGPEDDGPEKRRRTSVMSLSGISAASDASDVNTSPITLSHPPAEKSTEREGPLSGLTVVIIHVKDTLKDGAPVGDTILRQLHEYEAALREVDGVGLGCEFVISSVGESYHF